VAGYEGQFFLRFAYTLAAGNGGQFITQKIENVQTLAGQTATISFWAKAGSAISMDNAVIRQNFGSGGSTTVQTTVGAASLTTSWQRFSFTVSIPSISGKTIGTNSFLELRLFMPATSSTTDIWGVQVEAGSTATPFQTATGTIQGELAACQRYYYRNTTTEADAQFATGIATSTSQVDFMVAFPVSMRVKPSTAEYGNLEVTDTVTPLVVSTAAIFKATQTTAYFYVSSLSSVTQYRPYFLQANTSAGYIGFSAEL
jgi:hypothetical protein